jgi:hypothetical protein
MVLHAMHPHSSISTIWWPDKPWVSTDLRCSCGPAMSLDLHPKYHKKTNKRPQRCPKISSSNMFQSPATTVLSCLHTIPHQVNHHSEVSKYHRICLPLTLGFVMFSLYCTNIPVPNTPVYIHDVSTCSFCHVSQSTLFPYYCRYCVHIPASYYFMASNGSHGPMAWQPNSNLQNK